MEYWRENINGVSVGRINGVCVERILEGEYKWSMCWKDIGGGI